ncbi:MAG TPA: DUF5606 domain-containing protein [Flavobacteriaceae bacterium]|nr:DUF5606 domain-containing protein [Flavobacteriaceae bacterium]
MSLEKILSISGKPGLYRLLAQTRTGFLAESLIDGKKASVNLRQNVSLLSEIAIYTLKEEVPLREIFKKIQEKENGGPAISHKESKEKLEEYFFEILPDYDEDKVYVSDIKKVIQWYNLLQEKKLDDFSAPENTSESEALKVAAPQKNPVKALVDKGGNQKASSAKKGNSAKNTVARKAQ